MLDKIREIVVEQLGVERWSSNFRGKLRRGFRSRFIRYSWVNNGFRRGVRRRDSWYRSREN